MRELIATDIQNALDAKAYLSALALALAIPDICSKEQGAKAYCFWYNEYVVKPYKGDEQYIMTAEECYALRCSFLHQMNTDIDSQKIIKDLQQKGKHIVRIYSDCTNIAFRDSEDSNVVFDLNIKFFINLILEGYKAFLKDNPSFDFNINNIDIK